MQNPAFNGISASLDNRVRSDRNLRGEGREREGVMWAEHQTLSSTSAEHPVLQKQSRFIVNVRSRMQIFFSELKAHGEMADSDGQVERRAKLK